MGVKIKRRISVNNILLYILIFFGLFDTARNYTYLPIAFGYLKDIVLIFLFCMNINLFKNYLSRNGTAGILIFYSFMTLGRGFLFSTVNCVGVLTGIIKFFEIFMFMTLFFYWDKVFKISYKKVIHFYVYAGTSILIFVNIFGYFIPNPIVSRHIWNGVLAQGFYSGRITVGQPPIAVYPVIVSLIYLMVFEGSKTRIILYLIALFISTSNTGIVSVALCFIILLVLKNNKKKLFQIIAIGTGMLVLLYWVKSVHISDFLRNIISIYGDKIIKVLSGESDVGLTVRALHGRAAISELKSVFDILIGKGMYGYFSGRNPYRLVENTYISIYCSMGIIGLLLWILYFVKNLSYNIWLYLKYQRNSNIFLALITIVILCHMYTLDVQICYTIYFSYALFYMYFTNQQTR